MEGNATATNTLNVLRGKIASISPNALDTSLSVEGAAAEAKATGDAIDAVKASLNRHTDNNENPHAVTKKQVGLEFADNTADMDKPVSTAQAEAIAEAKKAGTDAQNALSDYVLKEEGKGLSTNDFTNEYKEKLDGIGEGGGGGGTGEIADGAITHKKLAADAVRIRKENAFIYASAFEYSTDNDDYAYRAEVAIDGAEDSMKPDVTFNYEQISSGIYAPFAMSYSGGVYIYASEVPAANITIPVIDLWR